MGRWKEGCVSLLMTRPRSYRGCVKVGYTGRSWNGDQGSSHLAISVWLWLDTIIKGYLYCTSKTLQFKGTPQTYFQKIFVIMSV